MRRGERRERRGDRLRDLAPRLVLLMLLGAASVAAQATNFVREGDTRIKLRVPVQLFEGCAANGDCVDMIDDVIGPKLDKKWEKIVEDAWNGHSFCDKKVVIKASFEPMLEPFGGKNKNRVNVYPPSARKDFEWRTSDPARFDPERNRVAEWLVDMTPEELIEQFGRLLGLEQGAVPGGKVSQSNIDRIMEQHGIECDEKEKDKGKGGGGGKEKRSQACKPASDVYESAFDEVEDAMQRTQAAIGTRLRRLKAMQAFVADRVLEDIQARHTHMAKTLEDLIGKAESANRADFEGLVKQAGKDPADFGERDFQHHCDVMHNAAMLQLINFYFAVAGDMLSSHVNGASHEWLLWAAALGMRPEALVEEFLASRYEPKRPPPHQLAISFSITSSPVANQADLKWYRQTEDAREKYSNEKGRCLRAPNASAAEACRRRAEAKYCKAQDGFDAALAQTVSTRLNRMAKGFDAEAVRVLELPATVIPDAYDFASRYVNHIRIKKDAPTFDVPGVGRMNMGEHAIYMINQSYVDQLIESHLGESGLPTRLAGSTVRYIRDQAEWFEEHKSGWKTHLSQGLVHRSHVDCKGGENARIQALAQDQWQKRRAELYAQNKKQIKRTRKTVDDCARAVIACYGPSISELQVFLDNAVAADLLKKVIVLPRQGGEVSSREIVYIPAEVYEQGWSLDYAVEVLMELNIVIDAEDKLGATPEQYKESLRETPKNGSNVYGETKKRLREALEELDFQRLLDECIEKGRVECDLRS